MSTRVKLSTVRRVLSGLDGCREQASVRVLVELFWAVFASFSCRMCCEAPTGHCLLLSEAENYVGSLAVIAS